MPKATTPPARYLRLSTAAERYDISTKTLRRRIADGSLTGHRFGRKVILVDPTELEALLRPIPTTRSTR